MTGVIFDFNGTLFRDSDKHEAAWQVFAKKHTGHELSSPDYADHVHGRNNSLILEYFFGSDLTETQIEAFALEKERIYRELCLADQASLHLIKGAEAYFDWLVANEVPRTIATAANGENMAFYFDVFELGRWFDEKKVVFDDGTLQSKPNPAPYLKASTLIEVPISEITIFEDSTSGIQAANNAKAKQIIAVSTEGNQAALRQLPNVQYVMDDFTEPQLKTML
ncbi:HAD family hydrolase [Agrilactobacillus yilanensis]|uniref:HAD family hydrolase n=1 Tax=Agrilactobacillus yilanensis TaxID=2485997 RepID=A0ABW4J422_9LACO|nr:HAD family phosphatase [Agrilactobacillus yilanensis]